MNRETFDDYIRRFNAQDTTGFETYIAPDMKMQNGGLHFEGVDGMKEHYAKIWSTMKETLTVVSFVSSEDRVAVHLKAHFDVLKNNPDSVFGSVREGEQFDYDGVIMYTVENGKFKTIKVAYLSFTRTDLNGVKHSIGLAH
jgi:hypothetical protein